MPLSIDTGTNFALERAVRYRSLLLLFSGTKTWENTIGSALSTKSNYFLSGNDVIGAPGYWSLRNEDDPSITKDSGTAKPFGAPPKAPKEKKRKTSKPPSGSAKGGKKKKTETGEKPAPNPEVKSNKKKAIPLPVLLPKMPFRTFFTLP